MSSTKNQRLGWPTEDRWHRGIVHNARLGVSIHAIRKDIHLIFTSNRWHTRYMMLTGGLNM